VALVDLRAVEPQFPIQVTTLRHSIEEARVLFPVGAATWTTGSGADIDAVADAVRRLNAATAELGYSAHYLLVGRTDTTGSRETNRTLSQRRADAVRAALVARALPPGQLLSRGVGTSDPLRSDDVATARRINRSVSIVVRLTVTGDEGNVP
jgi:outer membrane protein OmpA-like peptidoglycan-associated protein